MGSSRAGCAFLFMSVKPAPCVVSVIECKCKCWMGRWAVVLLAWETIRGTTELSCVSSRAREVFESPVNRKHKCVRHKGKVTKKEAAIDSESCRTSFMLQDSFYMSQ